MASKRGIAFMCGTCGDIVGRNNAAKHLFFCPNAQLSCLNCPRKPIGMEFAKHIECIKIDSDPANLERLNVEREETRMTMLETLEEIKMSDEEKMELCDKLNSTRFPLHCRMSEIFEEFFQKESPRLRHLASRLFYLSSEKWLSSQENRTSDFEETEPEIDEFNQPSNNLKKRTLDTDSMTEVTAKVKRKEKHHTDLEEVNPNGVIDGGQIVEERPNKLKMKVLVREVLEKADQNSIAFRKLKKKVVLAFLSGTTDVNPLAVERIEYKLLKELNRNSSFKYHDNRVILLSKNEDMF